MSQRYFEDVNVNDEMPPVEKLPTVAMAENFMGRGGGGPIRSQFTDADAGRALGVGGAIVPGTVKLAWITQFANDWAGAEGHVAGVRAAYRRPDVAEKPLVIAGRVVDKRQEGGKNIVELEVVTLAEGEPSVRGNITVELPSRG